MVLILQINCHNGVATMELPQWKNWEKINGIINFKSQSLELTADEVKYRRQGLVR